MQGIGQAQGRRVKIGAVAVLTGAAGVLALAPQASAGKVTPGTATVNVAGIATTGTARALCPSGTRAFAGGYQTSTPALSPPVPPSVTPTAQNLIVVNESRRSGGRGWRVTGSQLGTGSGTLTAIAYCHPARSKQVAIAVQLAAAGRSESTATVSCPKGTFAVSGGFTLPVAGSQSQFVFPTMNVLAGKRKWTVHGVRGSGSAPSAAEMVAYGYCAPGGRLRSVPLTKSVTTAASNPLLTAEAGPCVRGAASGGFKAPYTQNAATRETIFVTESRLTRTGWRVSGQPVGTTGLQLNLSAFANCK